MATNDETTQDLLAEVEADLDQEARRASTSAKLWIGARAALILVVIGYMSWLMGALSSLDARALTGIAAIEIEERLPELRSNLRDYALEVAPELTDQARDLVIRVPTEMRRQIEGGLLEHTELLIADFESSMDAAISDTLDAQRELLREQLGEASAEEQLDALILGISDSYRETMTEALDELYIDYSEEIRRLNDYLEHLRTASTLTPTEQIDRELIEVWMALVHGTELIRLASLTE